MQACFAKVRAAQGGSGNTTPGAGGGGAGGGGFSQGGGGNGRPRDFGAFAKCLPARLRQFRRTITTPQQTLKQVLAPPQTNIKSSAYAIGGVDQTKPDIGLVTPAQVTSGRYLSTAGGREALVGTSYAANHKLKVGSTITLNGTTFTVVGLVQPPLGGQTADVYLPLKQLQTLAHEPGLANVALVRATNSSSVGTVQREITQNLGGASVASAKQVADRISGSLVDASNLAHNLGLVIAIVVAAAAFLLAIVLTLSSVGKRVRELGTLKALGWSQRLVVRQVVAESLDAGNHRRAGRDRDRRRRDGGDTRLGTDADGAFREQRHVAVRARIGCLTRGLARGRAAHPDLDRAHRLRVAARDRRRSDRRSRGRIARRSSSPRRRAEDGGVVTDEPLYEVRDATRSFRRGDTTITAVDAVDLNISAGEFVALEGPSGSGKTTLLQLLGALDRPSGGQVFFGGRDLATLGDSELAGLRLRSFGFVFQQFNLIPTLNALENVEARLAPTGVGSDELRERSLAALAEVGLAERASHLPAQLSGGEQQRVAIARALVVEPSVILADEPTGNLDSRNGADVVEQLAGLAAQHGATVIVATHDADLASRAPRRLAMRDGRLVAAA